MSYRRTGGRLAGFTLGALSMYLFDPISGKRRQAYLRNKASHFLIEAKNSFEVMSRDLYHRAQGLVAETRASLTEGPVPDHTLKLRIRAAIGRAVSHPKSIEVHAHEGRVTLLGKILESELEGLLSTVSDVRGVHEVSHHLDIHASAEDIPELQGGRTRRVRESILQSTPASRALWGLLGAILLMRGLRRYDRFLGRPLSMAGLGLVLRALTPIEPLRQQRKGRKTELKKAPENSEGERLVG